MKRLSELIGMEGMRTFIPDVPRNIRTILELIQWLRSQGIIQVDMNDEGIHHYGWVNQRTKTSLYLGSTYGTDPNVYWAEDSLADFKMWREDDYPDVGLDNPKWRKIYR